MREMSFGSPKNLDEMARAFVQAVKAGRLVCYDDEEGRLRRDFGKFSIDVKMPTGYRLTAVSDEHGHADVGTALVIALPRAVELMGGWGRLQPDESLIADEGGDEKDDEETRKHMPRNLRGICEAYDELEKELRDARGR